MLNTILLALSVSIDSFGIGITYGIRNTKITFISKIVLFVISIFFTLCSFFLGKYINSILSEFLTRIISSSILIILGIVIFINPIPFDFDNSKAIDIKEAFFLGICLSLDSICVGIGSSIGGLSNLCFPLLVAIFQLLFISMGIIIGKKLIKKIEIPDNILNILSGGIIVFFGVIKLWI